MKPSLPEATDQRYGALGSGLRDGAGPMSMAVTSPRSYLHGIRRQTASVGHRLAPVPLGVLVLFGVGFLLRIVVAARYSSVTLTYYGGDSTRYMRLPFTGYHGLFSDPNIPAGYAAFLHVARWISNDIVFTIGLQHLMGIGTAALLLLALRRLGAPWWAASIPAAVALLSGDHLFLETSILTEPAWMLLLAAALWATFRASPYTGRSSWWLALAGALFSVSAVVRHLSLFFALFAAVWVGWDHVGPVRERLRFAGVLLVPAVILIGSYVAVARIEHGYAGFTDVSGQNLYGRVAQLANCKDFTPPAGTRALCNDVPLNQRDEGTFYYTDEPASPYYRAFGTNPRGIGLAGRFARTVILHEPLQYLKAVVKDLARYLAPYAIVSPKESGVSPGGMSFANTTPQNQGASPAQLAAEYSVAYSGVDRSLPALGIRELLGGYQEVFRLNGVVTLVLLALAIAGCWLTRGHVRRSTVLLLVLAAYLYVAPVALSSYDVRYGVPAGLILAAAGGIGAWAAAGRLRGRFGQQPLAVN
jgi:hypothetical protein